MSGPNIYINGRFLGGAETAVNQVAYQLTKALLAHEAQGALSARIKIVVPRSVTRRPKGWPIMALGRSSGVMWEQTVLPRLARRGLVVNLTNSAPLIGSHYLTMLHDAQVFDVPESYPRMTRVWRQMIARSAGRGGRRIVTVSQFSKDRLLANSIGSTHSISVVPNGADHLPAIARDVWTSGPAYVVAQANLLPHKNIAVLLEAFTGDALGDTELWLTGAPTRADFERAGLHVPKTVRFTGFLAAKDLARTYAGAMAVCVPSLTEGFGLPVIEAMRLGTPALTSPYGALSETGGDAAVRVNPFSAEDWRAAIRDMCDDRTKSAEISARSIAHAQAFTWARAGSLLSEAIADALNLSEQQSAQPQPSSFTTRSS